MALQAIRPDFSGSAESMQQAQRGIAQVGTFANEWMDRLAKEKAVATEEARYQTELARQKVLDDRATTLFNRQETDIEGAKQLEAMKSDVIAATAQETAFNDPRYKDALAKYAASKGGVVVDGSYVGPTEGVDITNSEAILREYGAKPTPQTVVPQQTIRPEYVPQGVQGLSTGNISARSTPSVVATSTPKSTVVPAVVSKPSTVSTPTIEVHQTDKMREVRDRHGNVLGVVPVEASPGKDYSAGGQYSPSATSFRKTVAEAFTGNQDPKIQAYNTNKEAMLKAIDKKYEGLESKIPKKYLPASSALTKETSAKLDMLATKKQEETKRAMDNLLEGKMRVQVTPKSQPTTQTPAIPQGVKPANKEQAKAITTDKPISVDVSAKTLTKVAQRAGIPTSVVQKQVQDSNNLYQSFIDMLPKDKTEEVRKATGYLDSMAANLGMTVGSYDSEKAVKKVMGDGDITEAQKTKINMLMEGVKEAQRRFERADDRNFEREKLAMDNYFKSATLQLQKLKMKQDEKVAKMNPVLQALAIKAGGMKLEDERPMSAKDIQAYNKAADDKVRADYKQMIEDSYTGTLLNPDYATFSSMPENKPQYYIPPQLKVAPKK